MRMAMRLFNKQSINEINRKKTHVNYRLINNTRRRIHQVLKVTIKSSSTKGKLGKNDETFEKKQHMTPEMNCWNFENGHVKPISLFDISKDMELREAFNWVNTQPLLKEVHHQKEPNFFSELIDCSLSELIKSSN